MKLRQILLISAIFLKACSDPDPQISIDSIDIKYDQQARIKVNQGSNTIDPVGFTWKLADEMIGTIDANGVFHARKVGETTVQLLNSEGQRIGETKVVVSPYSMLCAEPVTEWGASIASILSSETRSISIRENNHLEFNGENEKIKKVIYELGSDSKLNFSILQLSDNETTKKEADVFFKERYPESYNDGKTSYYYDDKKNQTVYLTNDEALGFSAIYIPYSKGGRVQMKKDVGR